MINFIDLKKEFDLLREEIVPAVNKIMEQSDFILGEEVNKFENDFANYCGVKYAIGVASGSDALKLALRALSIGKGDEVITVSNTFIATAFAIHDVGATPVWVDINPDTFNINPDKIVEAITDKTKAIIVVHLYGQTADMKKIVDITRSYNIKIIEDACQSHGASIDGQIAGSLGDVAAFSFYPSKNLGCYGDGGMVTTNNDETHVKIMALRNYGQKTKNCHEVFGYNSRLDTIQATILNIKLRYLDDWNIKKANIANMYNNLLEDTDSIKIPTTLIKCKHVFHQYVIRVPQNVRQKLIGFLSNNNIPTMIHYPTPIHLQKIFARTNPRNNLPETEKIVGEILSLPIHPYLTIDEVKYIANKTKEFFVNEKNK